MPKFKLNKKSHTVNNIMEMYKKYVQTHDIVRYGDNNIGKIYADGSCVKCTMGDIVKKGLLDNSNVAFDCEFVSRIVIFPNKDKWPTYEGIEFEYGTSKETIEEYDKRTSTGGGMVNFVESALNETGQCTQIIIEYQTQLNFTYLIYKSLIDEGYMDGPNFYIDLGICLNIGNGWDEGTPSITYAIEQ